MDLSLQPEASLATIQCQGNCWWITHRSELVDQPEWTSLEGAPVPIRRSEPFEVKNATVVAADVVCDNGIVHVIDRVILPG